MHDLRAEGRELRWQEMTVEERREYRDDYLADRTPMQIEQRERRAEAEASAARSQRIAEAFRPPRWVSEALGWVAGVMCAVALVAIIGYVICAFAAGVLSDTGGPSYDGPACLPGPASAMNPPEC